MLDYLAFLFLPILSVVALGLVFWPHKGLFWKWRRGFGNNRRVLIEDALKHLYDLEYKGLTGTLQSVAGTLAVTIDRAARLLARLESLGLVTSRDEGFQLSAEGRSYALRIIRIHRLWERYLADETGVSETDWHRKAEKQEHLMTAAEADRLASQMGNPPFDPHGDPIPTAAGKMPPKKGKPLTDLKEGALGRIIHLEDEPNTIFAQLVAEGLHPGMLIRILEKTSTRLNFEADGEEIVLAPIVAANITVEELHLEDITEGEHESLAALALGEKGEVLTISKACRGQQRRRLMDLGIVPGTVITAKLRSASGDPTAYEIRGTTIGLRNQQAELIHIRRIVEKTS